MVKILLVLMVPAAFVWRHRADVIETLGAGCLVVAAGMRSPALGWMVAGLVLLAKSFAMGRAA